MKTVINYFFLLFTFLYIEVQAQPIEATLISHWDDPSLVESVFDNPYHDVWGAVVNGVEYGIVSSTDGFHFFNLSGDGQTMDEPVASVAGTAQGAGIAHRDMKVYQHYLYAVADEGPSALQVFDMSVLPDDPILVYESNEFLTTSHNIFIDEDNGVLYAAGGNGFTLKTLSLEDPENPTLLRSYPSSGLLLPYIHDLYVRDNIAYLNAAFDGLIVVDFSDQQNPQLLGTMDTYVQQGYNHSGWQSEQGDHYFMCDETHGTDIKVVDVSDLSDIEVIATMNAGSTDNQIVHNVYVQGDLLYASYYYDGLQVFDISFPDFPRRVAYYDTSDLINTSWFGGAWGVFVLPSGRALISDMNNGFYFFEALNLPPNNVITPNTPSIEACIGEVSEFEILVGDDFEGTVSLNLDGSAAELDVTISALEAEPGGVLTMTVAATEAGSFDLVVEATDGTTTTETVIPVEAAVFPDAPQLLAPTDERENVSVTPLFLWVDADPEALSVRLELSTEEDNFEDNIFYTEAVNTNSIFLDFELDEGTTYFWRVVSAYPCGDNPTETFSFTTKITTSVKEIDGNAFVLAPNPAQEWLQLTFNQRLSERLQVRLNNLKGQSLLNTQLAAGENHLRLDVANLPAGVYVLQLTTNLTVVSRKIVVE